MSSSLYGKAGCELCRWGIFNLSEVADRLDLCVLLTIHKDERTKRHVVEDALRSYREQEVATTALEPRIEDMTKKTVGKRALWGPRAGCSAVLLKVSYSDATDKSVIAAPVFYA
jgi:hypothetical protein